MKFGKRFKRHQNIKFHSQPIYDDKHVKTKIKTFSGVINTLFSDNKIQKRRESIHLYCSNMY